MAGEHVEIEGTVVDCQRGKFKVQTKEGTAVLAQISGKMRKNKIHVLLGDNVVVKVSAYDLTNGIIVSRK